MLVFSLFVIVFVRFCFVLGLFLMFVVGLLLVCLFVVVFRHTVLIYASSSIMCEPFGNFMSRNPRKTPLQFVFSSSKESCAQTANTCIYP